MAPAVAENLNLASIGIMGGTGLYEIEGLKDVREIRLDTPFGDPSDQFILGTLEGKRVAFLSRHGRGHRLLPAEINYRANVYGFKMLGVEPDHLREFRGVPPGGHPAQGHRPRRPVLRPDAPGQHLFRRRARRPYQLGQPVCPELSRSVYEAATGLGLQGPSGRHIHLIEGPAFSTKAESHHLQGLGLRRHRHDGRDRSQALPRSRDLLRHDEPRNRLRRLARRGGGRVRGADPPEPMAQYRQRQGRHRPDGRRPGSRAARHVRLRPGPQEHDRHRSRTSSRPRRGRSSSCSSAST